MTGKKKDKLLILTSWYPNKASEIGGVFVQDQAQVLSRQYDVIVLVPRFFGLRDVMKGKSLPRSRVEECDGIRVCRQEILFSTRVPFRLQAGLYLRLAHQGFSKILTPWGKPDIIHAHVVWPAGWQAVMLGRKYSIPVVMTEHAGPFSHLFKSEFQKSLIRETLAQVNRVIAVSSALAEQIRSFVSTVDVDIVGNVIRTDFFTPPEDSPGQDHLPVRRFLSVASLEEAKGIQYLLQAVHLLIQGGVTSFEVYIGGDGPALPRLERMAKTLGLSDKCHFLGLLTRSMVRDWLRQCDVFVLPSLGETFGIVLGEAMACGKPVISTRCGVPDLLIAPETGFFVAVASAPALADAMDKFTSRQITYDPHLIRKSIVARFGEEAFLHNITAIYDQV